MKKNNEENKVLLGMSIGISFALMAFVSQFPMILFLNSVFTPNVIKLFMPLVIGQAFMVLYMLFYVNKASEGGLKEK